MMECTNPGLFSAGPVWLEPGEQRRHEALWQLARGKAEGEGGALRRHVDECRECARMVQSFRLLDNAVREGAELCAACPSVGDLSDYRSFELSADRRARVSEHLAACSFCREDLEWLGRTAESRMVWTERRRWLIFGVAAALTLIVSFPVLRSLPQRAVSPYADLTQIPV